MTQDSTLASNFHSGGDPATPSHVPVSLLHTSSVSAPLKPRDANDLRQILAGDATHRARLRIAAGASWLDAGRPVEDATVLDLSAIAGIVEYTPGDLTLTAGAATTLATIEAATAAYGQWLPVEPFGGARSTLGATLATASSGPLSGSVGLPRDLALGVEFVDGTGTTVRGGGRVVKNVAGFDLVRLLVGSWGSLGVITEATVRLRSRPECDESFAVPAPSHPADLAPLLRTIRLAPLTALSAELLDPRLSVRIGLPERCHVLVRLGGNSESLKAQRHTLRTLGELDAVASTLWTHLRTSDPDGGWSLRLSRRPSELATLWHAARRSVADIPGATLHATIERGVVRLVAPPVDAIAMAQVVAVLTGAGSVVGERLPPEGWALLPSPNDRLSTGVRRAFDPHFRLNPGILGGPP